MASRAPQNSAQWLLKAKKTKKPHFVKRGFFIVGLVNGLQGPPKQCTMAFKGQKNEKNTLCKTLWHSLKWLQHGFQGLRKTIHKSLWWPSRRSLQMKNWHGAFQRSASWANSARKKPSCKGKTCLQVATVIGRYQKQWLHWS